MSKRFKELMVEELRREYQGVESCLVVDIHRARGEQAVALRRYLAERGVALRVVKNSVAARALSQLGLGEVYHYLEGPRALAVGGEDLLELARALVDCARVHQVMELRGGVCAGRAIDPQQIEELARLGSHEALLATVIGALQAPLRQAVSILAAPVSGLATVLKRAAERTTQ